MSLIWMILVNTIIGMIIVPVSIFLVCYYLSKKYGDDITSESLDDNIKERQTISKMLGVSDNFMKTALLVLTVILWELLLPADIYLYVIKTKDLYEMRNR